MDRAEEARRDWRWLPAQMPGVGRLLAEKRRLWGNPHVDRCWRAGVERRQPGWFMAVEGALAVGVPPDDGEMRRLIDMAYRLGQPFLLLKDPAQVRPEAQGEQHGQD